LRDKNQFVSADYVDHSTQAAYTLRYFPQYAQIIDIVLVNPTKKQRSSSDNRQQENKLWLVRVGTLSRAYGIAQFIKAKHKEVETVQSISFDINASNWVYSRNITKENLISSNVLVKKHLELRELILICLCRLRFKILMRQF